MKKVLFLLCSYNGEKYIIDQVKSILSQIHIEITILIYDDNSNDNTILLINQLSDHRVSIIINKVNSGSPAFNFINSITDLDEKYLLQFDFLSLSDQDDIWLNNKTIEAINLLNDNKASFYASNLTIWNTQTEKKYLLKKDYKQTQYDFLFEGASAGCTYILSIDLILKFKKDISKVDFREWQYLSHDWLLYFYSRYKNIKVIIDSNSYILYRIHESNVHGTMNLNSIDAFKSKIKLFYSGWYHIQISNFSKFILSPSDHTQILYYKFNKNWLSRIIFLLKYRNQIFRSKKKYLIFFVLNIFNFRTNNI